MDRSRKGGMSDYSLSTRGSYIQNNREESPPVNENPHPSINTMPPIILQHHNHSKPTSPPSNLPDSSFHQNATRPPHITFTIPHPHLHHSRPLPFPSRPRLPHLSLFPTFEQNRNFITHISFKNTNRVHALRSNSIRL
mgnify:CR=1 FL=1